MSAFEPDSDRLRATIEHLAALDRLPCSPGEREAAEWIAVRLDEEGARARIEEEQVHGTFIWPLALPALVGGALAGLAVLRGRRLFGLLGAISAALQAQDLMGGPQRRLRRALPQAPTPNVVAEVGPPYARHTVVVYSHHDAARTSFIFDQTVPRLFVTKLPWLAARVDRWPPVMMLVVGGPALVAWGALRGRRAATRTGTVLGFGAAAVLGHMRTQPVVPGANDNLTGVAAVLELARWLREQPIDGVRVILFSAGAEESNQDGTLAFARRHFASLPRDETTFLCLDTVGSGELTLIEGEGFLRMFEYPAATKDLVARAAADVGVHVRRGLRLTFATDGLVPLRAGYPVASIGSVNEWLVPANYHWPTDTPDRVDYAGVVDATRLARRVIERIAGSTP